MAKSKKTCFVIGPIGDPASETREWSNVILDCIIDPAVTACGYEKPIRADHISQVGMITVQVLEHVIGDDLVVADLTNGNPNVYYELAVRHAAKKPFVQVIKEGQSIPFDLKDLRTIPVSRDIRVAKKAQQQLQRYIPEVEKQADKIVTPISMAASLELMRDSGDVRQQELADVISKLDTLTSLVKQSVPETKEPSADIHTWMQATANTDDNEARAIFMLRSGCDAGAIIRDLVTWAHLTKPMAQLILAKATLILHESERVRARKSKSEPDSALAQPGPDEIPPPTDDET